MSDLDIAAWIQQLTPNQRKVVVLYVILDLTFLEVAEVIGRSRARVWQHWMKALQALPS